MKFNIAKAVNTACGNAKFMARKRSPELLAVAGVVGIAASFVMACRETTKVSQIVEEHKSQMDEAEGKCEECRELGKQDVYSEEDLKKDKTIIMVQTCVKVAKIYAPAVSLAVLSVGCMLGSNHILRKRYAAMSAAYVAVDKSFKEYRNRVAERFGDEIEKQLRYNVKQEEVEETIVDEKGKEKTVKKTIDVVDQNYESDYMRYFTKGNIYYDGDDTQDSWFIQRKQNQANDRLRAVGHITLNEVYESLGFQPTKAGLVVGWRYEPGNNPDGDNYVQFNCKKVYILNELGNHQEAWAIDFNVDGNIYEKLA